MINMAVFCINGIALSGKDSFVNRVKEKLMWQEEYKAVECISTIDPVKELYTQWFGWDGVKTPEHRKNLNVLKQIWISTSNGPLMWTQDQIIRFEQRGFTFLFVMVREFSEMQATKELAISMGLKSYTVEVIRPGVDIPPIEQEFLDSHPVGYEYDIIIHNPTVDTFPNLPHLDAEVDKFLTKFNG